MVAWTTALKILSSLIYIVMSSNVVPCSAKRPAKAWSKMDLDGLEKQWEEGDEEEELKTEQQMMFEMLERRRTEAASTASSFDPSMLDKMDAAQIGAMVAGQKDAAGPTMMFAKVSSVERDEAGSNGGGGVEKLSKEETDKIGGRLQQRAQLGGLEVTVYAVSEGTVLVSSQRGWEGTEILDFLLSRPEVSKVTWNSKDFLPPTDGDEL